MTTTTAKFDLYVNRATALFEAGFTSKAAQKDALDYLNRAFAILTDGARSDILTAAAAKFPTAASEEAANMNRDAFVNAQGYWDMPDYPHLLRDKHEVMLNGRWDDACMIRDLRNAIKATAIVKIERKVNDREVAVQKSIRDIMAMRQSQFERGLKIADLFGGLPVSANVHLVTNQFGTTFLRAFYYLNGDMMPLNVFICIAQERERQAEAA